MRMVEIEAEEGRKNMLVSCQNFECAVAPSVTGETQDEGAYNWNRRERTEFGQILAGLKDRGMITQADVDRLERDGMKEVDHA